VKDIDVMSKFLSDFFVDKVWETPEITGINCLCGRATLIPFSSEAGL
jgi:hypothetical protein